MQSISQKLGCTPDTLRRWVRQWERDECKRAGLSMDSCIIAIAAVNICRSAIPSSWPKPASSLRSVPSATPTTMHSPRASSACSKPRRSGREPVEEHQRGRIRDPDVGRLVQQQTSARADRQYLTSGTRTGILRATGTSGDGRLTNTNGSPEYPGRFRDMSTCSAHPS